MVTINAANEPTAASGKVLQGQGVGTASAFSTATYPSTAGTSGKVLISDGTNIVSSTPTFPNASATAGKFIRSDGTNWIASTPTLPTSAGTSGKVLQSDGTNYVESTPTYPSASGSSGKILISDGTNNIYSTPTYPNSAGTSKNILQSDGTNFVSTPPILFTATGNISSANWKTINTSPVTVVSAPAAGKSIYIVGFSMRLNYGGTNAFTSGGQPALYFTNNAGTNITTVAATSYTGTATSVSMASLIPYAASTGAVAAPVFLSTPLAPGGNAAGDNTIDWFVSYYIVF